MRHGTALKMKAPAPNSAPDPLEELGEINSVVKARQALDKYKHAPAEVQEKVHQHIKDRFPDVLLERRRY